MYERLFFFQFIFVVSIVYLVLHLFLFVSSFDAYVVQKEGWGNYLLKRKTFVDVKNQILCVGVIETHRHSMAIKCYHHLILKCE